MSILKPLALSLAAGAGAAVAVYALLSMQKKHRRRKRPAPITAPAAATPLRAKDGETLVLTFKYLHSDLFISCANCENGIGAGVRHAAQLVLPMPPHGRRARRPDDACRRAATVRHRNYLGPGQFAEGPRANGPLPTRSRPALLAPLKELQRLFVADAGPREVLALSSLVLQEVQLLCRDREMREEALELAARAREPAEVMPTPLDPRDSVV